jgi:hypothetical protein
MKKHLPQDEYDAQLKKEFTGWWTPVWIVSMLEQRLINAEELVLLSIIDSFCRRRAPGVPPQGCWASNAYFRDVLGHKGIRSVQYMLKKLSDLKLIKYKYRNKRRHIFSVESMR